MSLALGSWALVETDGQTDARPALYCNLVSLWLAWSWTGELELWLAWSMDDAMMADGVDKVCSPL